MEVKKSPKADLEGKKSTWLLIGYVVVLAFMFVAFEWTERDIKIDTSQALSDLVFEEEMVPITEQEQKIEVPPPPEVPAAAEILDIVDDDADVEEINDNPSIDHGLEDAIIGDEMYYRLLNHFEQALEAKHY